MKSKEILSKRDAKKKMDESLKNYYSDNVFDHDIYIEISEISNILFDIVYKLGKDSVKKGV